MELMPSDVLATVLGIFIDVVSLRSVGLKYLHELLWTCGPESKRDFYDDLGKGGNNMAFAWKWYFAVL